MGVIYGYISLTDNPLDSAIPEAMRKANSFWEPDGDGLWQDERAAMGSLIMFNTPEAIFERQPIHFEEGRKVMVATARIDNRDDLCRAFSIPLSARDMYPDSYYIRLAYEKWGEDCPDHLIGDWSFAVWDKVNRKLFVARDHHGIMACYYYKGPDFFVFSSSLKGILCLPQVPKKVNEYKIAQILVNWNEGGPPTCYEDIFRLPPSHTITLKDGNVSTNRYWYLEHTPEIHLKNDQEYIDMFRDLYTEAVRCRLRSYRPVGTTLSGGLDSGSVCILAAQELAKYGKRLPAFTAVPLHEVPNYGKHITNEGPLAAELAAKLGNVDLTLLNSKDISPFQGIDEMLKVHDQPGFAVGNAYWLLDILAHCKKNEIGILLTGQGGNMTVSWPPNDLLNYKNDSLYLKIINRCKLELKFITSIWCKDFIISEKLLKKQHIKGSIKKAKLRQYFKYSYSLDNIRLDIIKPGKSGLGCTWWEMGLPHKIEVRDATLDLSILKFSFGIRKTSTANTRKMFNTVFCDFFSKDIMYGNIRGQQSTDLVRRINNEPVNLILDLNQKFNILSNYISLQKIINLNNINNKRSKLKILQFYSIQRFMK
jgi:asparagine synthase (glutamine-hydrolysing)